MNNKKHRRRVSLQIDEYSPSIAQIQLPENKDPDVIVLDIEAQGEDREDARQRHDNVDPRTKKLVGKISIFCALLIIGVRELMNLL